MCFFPLSVPMAFYLNNENFKASKTNEQNAKRNMADRQQRWFSRTEFRFGLVKKSDMVAHIHVYILHTIFLIYILATFLRISSSTNGNEKKQRLTTVNAWILSARCVFNRTTTCFCSFVRFDFFLAVDVLVCNSYTISLLPITWQHLKIFLRSTPLPLPLLLSLSSPS